MSGQLSDALEAVRAAEIIPARAPNLAVAALYYVERLGWPVFPLKPRGKTPLTEHGFHDASLDPAVVRDWWTRHADANIGLPTGIRFDVIDADGPEGVAAWQRIKHRDCQGCSTEAFCGATGGFTVLAEAFTPGNSTVGRGPGRHLYLPPSGRGNSARVNGQPLDIRGVGGYVCAAPSVNIAGAAYSWLTPPVAP